ncbi:MAG: tyrosine-type recombinase/integrase [Gammaproteobacteria bacterium]|nr:tyrosine-type recombinase/integrase [Gammaproteobacteria bacterium]
MIGASAKRTATAIVRKEVISPAQVKCLIEHLAQVDTLHNLRLAAMIQLVFSGCLRIGECLALNLDDIQMKPDRLILTHRTAKTDKTRQGQHTIIARNHTVHCPGKALERYLARAHLQLGSTTAIFRQIQYHPTVHSTFPTETRLTYTNARQDLLRLMAKCNISGNFSWHSFRAGAASAALNQGIDATLVREHGRWRSENGMSPYIQVSTSNQKRVSQVLQL